VHCQVALQKNYLSVAQLILQAIRRFGPKPVPGRWFADASSCRARVGVFHRRLTSRRALTYSQSMFSTLHPSTSLLLAGALPLAWLPAARA